MRKFEPALFQTASTTLGRLLVSNQGEISSSALRKELQNNDIVKLAAGSEDAEAFAKDLVLLLKAYSADGEEYREYAKPAQEWKYLGRSFLTSEELNSRVQETESKIISESREAIVLVESEIPATPEERKQNKQEEARLGGYVSRALEEIYDTDFVPESVDFCFDVHSNRGGGDYENIDVLAVHWRTESRVEYVTVEIKLEFTARLVQQAANYRRFSHRVWIAVPTDNEGALAAEELRQQDERLFDHCIQLGLGILSCKRAQGKSYRVSAIHWPSCQSPLPGEVEAFQERYRKQLEDGHVLERKNRPRPRAL